MKSLSTVGLGLSLIFGCLLLALLLELCYLLWWKKRLPRTDIESSYVNSPLRDLLLKFCCNSPLPSSSRFLNPKTAETHLQASRSTNKRFSYESAAGRNHHGSGNEMGPGLTPRFLFTIAEEPKEGLESEEEEESFSGEKLTGGLESRGKSLSDLFINSDNTPYMTPLASPSLFNSPLTPFKEPSRVTRDVFSPLFESATDAVFNEMVRSPSPPPKFKFLQDAEEKLQIRLRKMEECKRFFREEKTRSQLGHSPKPDRDKDDDEETAYIKATMRSTSMPNPKPVSTNSLSNHFPEVL